MTARILIADDSPVVRACLEDAILPLGVECIMAECGTAALQAILANKPDLVLLDLCMPDMTGEDVLIQVKKQMGDIRIPVIVVTSKDTDEVRELVFSLGATDYIHKPFSAGKVRVRVKNALDRAETMNALKLARDEAFAATRAKTEFLANMSHEIRTPMNAILGFADVLLANVTSGDDISAVKTIRRNGEYLLSIIDDILDLSKVESSMMRMETIPLSPAQTVAEVISLLEVRSKAKGLRLSAEFDGPIPQTIFSDPTRLRQILVNLIGNAVKFTSNGGVRLVVKWTMSEEGNSQLQFDVIDTGIGMTPEQICRLFKPFSQADTTTTRKFGGTGLGLTISKRLAEMLGGTIIVLSEAGQGSTFRLLINTGEVDVTKVVYAPTDIKPESNVPLEEKQKKKLNCRVLLAEDGPDNQRLMRVILEKVGVNLTTVENGALAVEQALAALSSGASFDLILMDMQMPVMDGYAATTKLRQSGYRHPIVALTAHAMSGDREKCEQAGCDDYMTKPIIKGKLLELVQRHSRSADAEHSAEFEPEVNPIQLLLKGLVDGKRQMERAFEEEKREHSRTSIHFGVQVIPLVDAQPSWPCEFTAITKDLSAQGIGLLLDRKITADEVLIGFPKHLMADYLRVCITHCRPIGSGFYETGGGVLGKESYPERRALPEEAGLVASLAN